VDHPTIQSGVNAAGIGDTVVVAPGIYIENVLISAKPVTLLGDVTGQTVILRADLSQAANYTHPNPSTYLSQSDTLPITSSALIPSGGGTSPLVLANNFTGVVEVAGFTIELGSAVPGLYCFNSTALIHHNHFRKNTGGGVLCSGGQRSTISDNLFTENSAYAGGGAAMTGGASADLYDNEFRSNRASLGGAVFCIDDDGHTISGNRFLGNYAGGGGGGIYYYHGGIAEVTDNLFVDDTSNHGGGVDNSDRQNLHLTHNTFDRCVAGIANGGGNAAWWANGAYIGGVFKNNIVTHTESVSGDGGSIGCDGNIVGTVAIDFNDFFDNSPADVFRFSAGPNDIYEDPLYCDPANGNYHLAAGSPSAGTGEGGSNRGAFDAGCGVGAIEVDFLPGNCPNIISIGGPDVEYQGTRPGPAAAKKPTVAVAILGTKTFDVGAIDPESMDVLGLTPLSYRLMDVSRPLETRESNCECNTMGPDGHTDLVLYLDEAQIIAAWGPIDNTEQRATSVSGLTKSGSLLSGYDCVSIKNDAIPVPIPSPFAWKDKSRLTSHPNPFNAATVIGFVLSSDQNVRVDVYDVLGRRVATLVDDFLPAGEHEFTWDATGRSSGMYFARFVTAGGAVTKQMVLMK
jgi:hypothetical protein